jgi:GGDEF domain-containing protein
MKSTMAPADDPPHACEIFDAYVALAKSLVPTLSTIRVYDGQLRLWGGSKEISGEQTDSWVQSLDWRKSRTRSPANWQQADGLWIALPLEASDGVLLGVFCACLPHSDGSTGRQLKPLLDCIHRDLASARPVGAKVRTLTERAAELEWLFEITSGLKQSTDDRRIIEGLLIAATQRLSSALGVLHLPEKRLTLTHTPDASRAAPLLQAWENTAPHLMTWAQRQNKPLVVNQARPGQSTPCKVMSIPIIRENGRVLGVMAFYNPPEAPNYLPRHVYLARHVGRQAASLIESQFDLMTGLYTRSGLEHMFGDVAPGSQDCEQCILYLDIDHMRIANEMHGFELGNELIVRVADLLGPPLLPKEALAARISGDRFAVILPRSRCDEGKAIAQTIQAAMPRQSG